MVGKPLLNDYNNAASDIYNDCSLDCMYGKKDLKNRMKHKKNKYKRGCTKEYNERRPHEALNNMTPIEWANSISNMKNYETIAV